MNSRLPKKSFARKIIRMRGYTDEQTIMEVAYLDRVSAEEAAVRIRLAREQSARRSVAQRRRRWLESRKLDEARRLVLRIAHEEGEFVCARDLVRVAILLPGRRIDTGAAFRKVCLPLKRDGLVTELRDDEDRFIGYVITEAGVAELNGHVP